MIEMGFIIPRPLAAKIGHTTVAAMYATWLAALNDRTATLARLGHELTPPFLRAVRFQAAIYRELVSDARFAYSQERAGREMKQSRDLDVVAGFVGVIYRRYAGDPENGKRFAIEVFDTNPPLGSISIRKCVSSV
jgi:hypothetical protein